MNKLAFLYPGQGAQYAGMGKDFYENSEVAAKVYDDASSWLDIDMKALCFEKNDLLDRTDYTQAAMVTTCIAMTKELEKHGILPDITAGLSLGEYAAIYAAGGMSEKDAIKTVWVRGQLMNKAVPAGKGAMAAVLGLNAGEVADAIAQVDGAYVANYNCPGQIVITGEKEAVNKAADLLKNAGARRVMPLNVSGPFHSPLLFEAGEELGKELAKIEWKSLRVPYVTNVDASTVDDISRSARLLERQVSSSVLWEFEIRNMIEQGVDTFIEIGPGKTLTGFMKKISKDVTMLRIGTWQELLKTVEQLKEMKTC